MKQQILLLILCGMSMLAQAQYTLTGRLTDETGDGIFAALVFEKGTNNNTTTDFNGYYSLRYSDPNSTIVYSFVGYERQELKPEGKSEINVTLNQSVELKAVEILGSRKLNRTSSETPVAIDIIDIASLTNTSGQLDINQLLQYSAPSFNSNKQSGSDGADHIDPASLRGLGPDQTLVLINGKRRHQSSLINIYGTRGRGNTGTDLNAIPAAAIERIEILRDGASAQYGSDAIAGVINIVLKKNVDEVSANVSTGFRNAKPPSSYDVLSKNDYDGRTVQFNGNYGTKIGSDGFINVTMDYSETGKTNRPVNPARYAIYRNQFGDASSQNFGTYFNAGFSGGTNLEVYMFGGFNYRATDAYAFTRDAGSERNVTSIYPNGFDPKIQSVISDNSFSTGIRSKLNSWNLDLNNTIGSNRFHYYGDNTLNASLEEKSPTRFDDGGFGLIQNTSSLNLSRYFSGILSGFNLGIGVENRIEHYGIFTGEEASYFTYGTTIFSIDTATADTVYRPGGAQGFPGFRPANEVSEYRSNIGAYIDGELDITKSLLVSAAMRIERYSDFGNTVNGKFATRLKVFKNLSLRASVSSGFRAPSLAQLYFNQTFTDVVSGNIVDKIIAKNNSPITRSLGIPELKQEKSINISGGITARYNQFTITIDPYYVQIKDRIVLTGAFDASNSPEVATELDQQDVTAVQFFTNAVNTSTTGLDVVLAYSVFITNQQAVRLSLAGNFNSMKIDDIYTNTKLQGKEDVYFGRREQFFLLASAPKSKINFTIDYNFSKFNVMLRFVQFGETELVNFIDHVDTYSAKMTTDLTLGYNLTKNVNASVGGSNIFNVYPDAQDAENTESGGYWDAVQMGFSGAYYFGKLAFKF